MLQRYFKMPSPEDDIDYFDDDDFDQIRRRAQEKKEKEEGLRR
jgi:hypothetical protein